MDISDNKSLSNADDEYSDLELTGRHLTSNGNSKSPELSKLKKKRGRKAADNYLANSKKELLKMRAEYDQEKAGLHVKERAKRRNRISALESRIKKRELQDKLDSDLLSLKDKIETLKDLLDQEINSETKDKLAKALTNLTYNSSPTTKRKNQSVPFVDALSNFLGLSDQ